MTWKGITMKTGVSETQSDDVDDTVMFISFLVGDLLKKAMEDAEVYCKHCNRTKVNENDIVRSIMNQCRVYPNNMNIPEMMQKFNQEKSKFASGDCDHCDDCDNCDNCDDCDHCDDCDDCEKDECGQQVPSLTSKNKCYCKICDTINRNNETWDSWVPETDIEKTLYNSINKTVRQIME